MKTPIIYKLDIFVLTQDFLDREYLIFSQIPFSDTVSFLIDNSMNILQDRYKIIKITSDNVIDFSDAIISGWVLSWKNSNIELKELLLSKLGQKVSIQYVNYEVPEDTIEPNKEDHINWERL